MDPNFPIPPVLPNIASTYGYSVFYPGIFGSIEDRDNYLSSLDSDTRDYVLKHTDILRTRADIERCVNELHGGR